jgi:hypothetical protein
MAIKVLTCESELESAKRLGYPTRTFIGEYASKYDNDIIIRWGNSSWSYTDLGVRSTEFKNVINPAAVIKQNCKKHEALKLLAHVVNVPTYYGKSVPKNTLAVVRPFEHAAGEGFSVKKGPFKIEPGTYGTKFIQTDAEYRVWFCGERTMCGRRVKMKINPDEQYPCRSNWGYQFQPAVAPKLHYQTLWAAKKIGLDCGAADILFHKGKYYFMELNSAPSVDHRVVLEFYKTSIEELCRKKFPNLFESKKEVQMEPSQKNTEQHVRNIADQVLVPVMEITPAAAPINEIEISPTVVSNTELAVS